jgi:N-acyl-D-aspartate/D-glutamate deacylase
MFDLVIRNGTIVDGTGRARCIGDVAVRDGLLVQVGGSVLGTGRREIDATGAVITIGSAGDSTIIRNNAGSGISFLQ